MFSAHTLAPYKFVDHELDRRLTRAAYLVAAFVAPCLGACLAISQHMA